MWREVRQREARRPTTRAPYRLGWPALLAHVGAGVRRQVHAAHVRAVDVRVELGGRDVGVPQELLDNAQVGAAFKQVRRNAVPQRVRMPRSRAQTAERCARHAG